MSRRVPRLPYLLAQWKDAKVETREFNGLKAEVPVELFKSLTVSAARVWERILACAKGDADRAREMYRTAAESFGRQSPELAYYMGSAKRNLIPRLIFVDCPVGRSEKPFTAPSRYSLAPGEETTLMRLNDVYDQGRDQAWRELRDVRDRYRKLKKH